MSGALRLGVALAVITLSALFVSHAGASGCERMLASAKLVRGSLQHRFLAAAAGALDAAMPILPAGRECTVCSGLALDKQPVITPARPLPAVRRQSVRQQQRAVMSATGGGDTGVIIAFCTVPSKDVGQKIASSLVENKLAACVNIIPGALPGAAPAGLLLKLHWIHADLRQPSARPIGPRLCLRLAQCAEQCITTLQCC